MKAIKHDKAVVIAAIFGGAVLAAAGLVVSGLNKSEKKAVEANVESFDVVDSEGMENLLSLDKMDQTMVGATLGEFYGDRQMPSEDTLAEEPATEEVTVEDKEQKSEPETEPVSAYDGQFLANVEEYLNVRSEGNEDAEIVGKIYAGSGGIVLEKGAEWSKIQSGNVTGYICNQYAWFDKDMESSVPYVCPLIATSTTDNLRLRTGAGTDYSISEVIDAGTRMVVIEDAGDWYAVRYQGQILFTSKEFVTVGYEVGVGISIEEEQAAIAAEEARIAEEEAAKAEEEAKRAAEEQEEAEEAAREAAQAESVETEYTDAYSMSTDDTYLLACLVMAEAGGECYEGKLAVANIVLNRLNGGSYGSSIHDVIYARGQFSVVRNGALNRALNNGPNEGSIQAANEALAGVNNVPGYTSFCMESCANYGNYNAYSLIGNQVFYR